MLQGFDVSHYNSGEKIRNYVGRNEHDFAFIKITEGISWVDETAAATYAMLKNEVPVLGFYHYARAETNSPIEEADHFIGTIQERIGGGRFLLALDFEGKSVAAQPQWIRDFCFQVESRTDGKCIIYMNKSTFQGYKTAFNDNGLWLAHWGEWYEDDPHLYGYLIAFHQTGINDGIDHDVFFGSMGQLEKYLSLVPDKEEKSGCSCGCCQKGCHEKTTTNR